MTVALVWPLNAAIAGPLASAQNLSLDDLLAGIPTYIAGYFHSYQELVKTRVSVPRSRTRAHTSREDLTLIARCRTYSVTCSAHAYGLHRK